MMINEYKTYDLNERLEALKSKYSVTPEQEQAIREYYECFMKNPKFSDAVDDILGNIKRGRLL